METQTRLSRHNKFISAENIIAILSVASERSECEFCYTLENKWGTNNSHTLSTLIVLYDYPHIFYVKNNPHLQSLDTDWIFRGMYIYIYMCVCVCAYGHNIYIYIYIYIYVCVCVCVCVRIHALLWICVFTYLFLVQLTTNKTLKMFIICHNLLHGLIGWMLLIQK